MSENTRTRIYCLLSRIGFGDLPGVQAQSGDFVTLAVIEKYFNLKIGEVWDEVFNELENENVSSYVGSCSLGIQCAQPHSFA